MNVRFLRKAWKVTVAEQQGKISIFAMNDRYGVGVSEAIDPSVYDQTPAQHRTALLKSLAMLSLIANAENLNLWTKGDERFPVDCVQEHENAA